MMNALEVKGTYMSNSKLITPEFRGSFVSLAAPRGIKGDPSSTPKYQITIAIDKGNAFWADVERRVRDAAMDKWGEVPKKLKSPVKDGDDSGYDNLVGMWTLGASNTRRPGIVDTDLQPIIDGDELYSGAWYRVSVRAYAWQHVTGGKGVSFSLDNVMKVRDDDAFDGSSDAATDFAEVVKRSEDTDDLLG